MEQRKFIIVKKRYYLAFTLLILFCSCSHQRVTTAKNQPVKNEADLTVYADVNEAIANNDFFEAKNFPVSVSTEKLFAGFELLLNQEPIKAENIFLDLWRTDSVYKGSALNILYRDYFSHTMWDSFMSLTEKTDSFPNSHEVVRNYYNFPKEEIVFPLNDSVFVPIKKFNYGNTPVIEVQINGNKKYFIVDTGFSFSTISPELAKECGITQGYSTIGMQDANNVIKKNAATPAYIEELIINKLKIVNHPIVVSDRLKFKILGVTVYKIDGVIGWNLLQKLKVQIDYKNKNILFCKSEKKEQNRGMINGISSPFITATATNGNKLLLHFDTGAKDIELSDNAKTKLAQKVSSEKTTTSFGLNSNLKEKAGIIKDFSFFIGDYMFNLPKIKVSKTEHSSGSAIRLNGTIGNSPFLNGMVTFDYQNGVFEYSEDK